MNTVGRQVGRLLEAQEEKAAAQLLTTAFTGNLPAAGATGNLHPAGTVNITDMFLMGQAAAAAVAENKNAAKRCGTASGHQKRDNPARPNGNQHPRSESSREDPAARDERLLTLLFWWTARRGLPINPLISQKIGAVLPPQAQRYRTCSTKPVRVASAHVHFNTRR